MNFTVNKRLIAIAGLRRILTVSTVVFQEEKKMKNVDADVIDLTVSFGELSSVENTPTKMEQDHHHSRVKDDER